MGSSQFVLLLVWALYFWGYGECLRPPSVTIGAVFTLNSTIGRVAKVAVETAVDDINANSKILGGTKLKLFIEDSNCNGFLGTVNGISILFSFLFFLLLNYGTCGSPSLICCVSSPTCAIVDNIGDTNELMEQVLYLATHPRKFTEMQEGELDSSTKVLETNVPHVEMKFSSEEDAMDYYKAYALAKGFGIRKGTTHNKKGERIHREIICSKEGFRKVKDHVSEKELPKSRCGCKTKLGITRNADNEWVVTRFIDDHNHDLVSPRKASLICCHRTLSSGTKLLLNSMSSTMVKPRHIHDIFIEKVGGIENVTCTQKDIENEITSTKRKLRGEDGSLIMQWLYKMKESNPSFFYRLKLEEDDHILSIFLVDATCKVFDQCFSDVITFDTTYKTNSFSMSFAPILGVNRNFNTTFFGFVLIFDEKVESFVWVFENWLEAIGGQQLGVILTDQDHAITAAVRQVFYQSEHRYCK
ncbi:hypothetical protein AMTRI_Chr13g121600 [Amborella trichopoda]